MLLFDHALAQRLEGHEAWSSLEHARTQARLYPETQADWLTVAGAWAVFAGKKAPLSHAYGLGMQGPVLPADLDKVEAFYAERGLGTRLRVCPLADHSLLELLAGRRYTMAGFMNVYARSIEAEALEQHIPGEITIRVATVEEARQWFEVTGAGGDWAEPDGISFMVVRTVQKPGARLFLAWQAGEPVGAGGLEIHASTAALMAAGTRPAFRGRGIHTALLNARLAAAAEAGCNLAMVHTSPGTISQRNVQRAGFELVYTSVNVVRPL